MLKSLVALRDWVDARLPIVRAWDTHMGKYYAPKNLNFWYFFGVLSILVLVNQLLTGIWLTMSFVPSSADAFASVEYIMRDVEYGWIIRYMHSTGASAFFAVVYLHMFRGLMYGSYRKPRELVWIFGMCIYLALMAEAFLGYVLPWGQMSFWGAQVIISLFGAIPVVGEDLVTWIRGDFLISGITLNRFFALHVIALPLVLVALVVLHLLALHEVGSNNPDGIEIKKNKDANGIPLDGIQFHPFYTVHDLVGVTVFLFAFCSIIFFMPEMGGYFLEHANFQEANALQTPAHIAPVWYMTPFYSVLRAVPDKLMGFIAMGAAIAILFVLPWLDRSPVKSVRYKGWFSRIAILVFAANFIILGVLGVKAPTPERTLLAQICSVIYFAFFIAMPFWTAREKCKPEPERVTMNGGLGPIATIGAVIIVALLTVLPLKAVGASSEFACGSIPCDDVHFDVSDSESLQRGAQLFTNYCMGCHEAKYSRYERVATDLGIPVELYEQHLKFNPEAKIGDLMTIAMPAKVAKGWFGATPPDLTLVARARGSDWLYTYLRNFYADSSRPWGVNNRVFKDVGMPHVLLELQGLQACAPGPKPGHASHDPLTGEPLAEDECGSFSLVEKGSMTPAEFDSAMYDLVNFLTYVAEPMQLERKEIGIKVLLFLCVFFVLVYLLNREYWRGIH